MEPGKYGGDTDIYTLLLKTSYYRVIPLNLRMHFRVGVDAPLTGWWHFTRASQQLFPQPFLASHPQFFIYSVLLLGVWSGGNACNVRGNGLGKKKKRKRESLQIAMFFCLFLFFKVWNPFNKIWTQTPGHVKPGLLSLESSWLIYHPHSSSQKG